MIPTCLKSQIQKITIGEYKERLRQYVYVTYKNPKGINSLTVDDMTTYASSIQNKNNDVHSVFFYANEHEPKHVHVVNGDDFVKIELASLKVSQNYMKPKDLKQALALVEVHRTQFERQWDEYFSQR